MPTIPAPKRINSIFRVEGTSCSFLIVSQLKTDFTYATVNFPGTTIVYRLKPAKTAPTTSNNAPSMNRMSLKMKFAGLRSQNGYASCKIGDY